MDKMLEDLNLNIIDLVKFILVIFLPLTLWFFTLKNEIYLNGISVESNKKNIEYIRDKQEFFNEKVLDKLEIIQKDISEIKGKIKQRSVHD